MEDIRAGEKTVTDTIGDLYEIRRLAEVLAFTGFVDKKAQRELCDALENFGRERKVS
jgi:hypothetical protein